MLMFQGLQYGLNMHARAEQQKGYKLAQAFFIQDFKMYCLSVTELRWNWTDIVIDNMSMTRVSGTGSVNRW